MKMMDTRAYVGMLKELVEQGSCLLYTSPSPRDTR